MKWSKPPDELLRSRPQKKKERSIDDLSYAMLVSIHAILKNIEALLKGQPTVSVEYRTNSEVQLDHKVGCPSCNAKGYTLNPDTDSTQRDITCPLCHGAKWINA